MYCVISVLVEAFLSGARVNYAMARDGLFFRSCARLHPTRHTPATALVYRRQVDQVKKAKADETEQLWQSLSAQARAGIASRRPGQRFDSLEAIEKAARIRPDVRIEDNIRMSADRAA